VNSTTARPLAGSLRRARWSPAGGWRTRRETSDKRLMRRLPRRSNVATRVGDRVGWGRREVAPGTCQVLMESTSRGCATPVVADDLLELRTSVMEERRMPSVGLNARRRTDTVEQLRLRLRGPYRVQVATVDRPHIQPRWPRCVRRHRPGRGGASQRRTSTFPGGSSTPAGDHRAAADRRAARRRSEFDAGPI